MTVVNCGPLPESHNSTGLLVSYSSGTTYNSIATYSCVFTHQLVGNNTERVCSIDGQWTGMEPHCEGTYNVKKMFINLRNFVPYYTDNSDNITAIPFINLSGTGTRLNRYNGAFGIGLPTPLPFGERLETLAYVRL